MLMVGLVQGHATMPPSSQLEDYIERSLDLQKRTCQLYRECVCDFVAFIGDNPAHWTCGAVEDWLHHLLTHGRTTATRKRGPCNPRTVRVYRKAIRYASKQFAKHGGQDFAANVSRIKADAAAPRLPLEIDEADRIVQTCASNTLIDIRDRALLILAFRTGLRRGGLHALNIEKVCQPKITTLNKGGGEITIEADTETFEVLDSWLAELRRHNINRGAVFRQVHGNEIGDRVSAFQIYNVFRKRAVLAGIHRRIFPHLARHSTVTWLRESGKSSAEVSTLTGQTERTIENIYTHVRTKGSVAEAIPSLLRRGNR